MTGVGERLRAIALTALIVTSLFTFVSVGGASSAAPQSYVVKQGSSCWEVTPLGDGTQNVSDFYDYRSPATTPSSDKYSSFGTTHLQENQVSNLFLYNGSDGVSLVMLHDKLGEAPYASTVTFNFSGLPTSREWVVEDDTYPGRDDNFTHEATTSTINWKWTGNRTDGAAVRGLEDTASYTAVEIDPEFNENATYWGIWPVSGGQNRITSWKLITGPDAVDPSAKATLAMDGNVTVGPGECPDSADPVAHADVPSSVVAGTTFRVDGSGSTDDKGIVKYAWDFGDGTTATGRTATHAYSTNGTYTINLTVTDGAGNTSTERNQITVTDEDAMDPTAALSAPSSATVGTAVTLDASASWDDGGIAKYRWDTDGDGTYEKNGTNATTQVTYQNTGTYQPTVMVVDKMGNNATATATVTVTKESSGGEQLDAAFTWSHTGWDDKVLLDASSSTGSIVSYKWDVVGNGNIHRVGKKIYHQYGQYGSYDVTLHVKDSNGNTDTATHTVTVHDNTPPAGAIDAPDSVTAGANVTARAVNLSDKGTIVHVCWTVDGARVGADFQKNLTTSFDETGNHTVGLLIKDDAGNKRTISKTIEVTPKPNDGGGGTDGGSNTNNGGYSGGTSGHTNDADDGSNGEYTVTVSGRSGPIDSFGTLTLGVSDGTGLDLTVDATESAPDGVEGPAVDDQHVQPLGYLDVKGTDDLTSVERSTFTFTVERSALADLDTSPRNLNVYRWTDGSWSAVDTEVVEETDETVTFSATGSGLSTFVIGVDRPSVTLADLSVSDEAISPGQSVEITARLANEGRANEVFTVQFGLDGETITSRELTVAAGRDRSITFTRAFDEPGSHTLSVNGEKVEVMVQSEETTVGSETTEPSAQSTETTSSTTGQPGFGVGIALVALLGAALLATRRR